MAPIFDGLKVIDISQVAAVPMSARIMADFGAEVIHVENPTTGDMFRHVLEGLKTGVQADYNYIFEHYNRNKKSLTLDLTTKEGQDIIHKLLETADVLTTNMRPYELERYHLEYETLKAKNPRLIGAYLNGFGKNGDEKNTPAFDHTAYWARSGIPHKIRAITPPLHDPKIPAPAFINSFGDHTTCLALVSGIFLALYDRERTGLGREVTTSLFQSAVHQLSWDISATLATGEDCMTIVPDDINPNPLVGQYRTRDDRWLLFSASNAERYLPPFLRAMGLDELIDDKRFEVIEGFIQNHLELRDILRETFLSKTLEEWKPLFNSVRVPFSPVQTLPEVVSDPQAAANNFFESYQHPEVGDITVVASPINVGDGEKTVKSPAPEFGQHTEEVLIEYGYSWEDIAELKDKGIIA